MGKEQAGPLELPLLSEQEAAVALAVAQEQRHPSTFMTPEVGRLLNTGVVMAVLMAAAAVVLEIWGVAMLAAAQSASSGPETCANSHPHAQQTNKEQ